MARRRHNRCYSYLNGDLLTATTSAIPISDALKEGGLTGSAIATVAAPDILVLVCEDEIMWVTAYTSGATTLATVLRGQEGTVAADHQSGSQIYNSMTKLDIAPSALHGWYQDNVVANQTAVALSLPVVGRTEVVMPLPGSVVGIAVHSNEARTAGTLTVDATINGAVTGVQAILDATNTITDVGSQDPGIDTYTAGQRIGVKLTTDGAWTPTTADISVTVMIVPA